MKNDKPRLGRWLALLGICIHTLEAGIDDYFKKIGEKTNHNQFRNIDFIYMINLDQRPEKFERSKLLLSLYGIYPYRFSAVNGWELSLEAVTALGVTYRASMPNRPMGTYFVDSAPPQPVDEEIQVEGRSYYCHCMSLGAIGCVLSHLSILQDAYDSGYQTIWILEDDVEIHQNPYLLSDLIDALDRLVGKEGWDVLFTDQDSKNPKGEYVPCLSFAKRPDFTPANPDRFAQRKEISDQFKRIGARYGSYSMIIRRGGMKKLLDFFKLHKIFFPYDLEYTLPDDIQLYALTSDVVSTTPGSPTDIGKPNYEKKSVFHGN